MSVLAVTSGGTLLGAADYKLGDLFVTKGTVGKFSFQSAVQSFQDSFNRNIVNLSTVAIGAQARLGYEVPHCSGRGTLRMAKRKLRLLLIPVAIALFVFGWILYCLGRKRRKSYMADN